ncbi:MAG: hypothetical protein Q8J89_08565 [Caulobacter sp.]|nr:hypothetical protein [Caulobacter sp.]
MTALLHEIWESTDDDGRWLPVCMIAGPDGDDLRSQLDINARLVTTFEAHSPFEAMTVFHRLMELGPYRGVSNDERRAYPEEALMRQFRG